MERQPIETAPRDGTPFLGWRDGRAVISKYNESSACNFEYQPSHWMPLPPSPQEREESL
jgi:hypothetical protein